MIQCNPYDVYMYIYTCIYIHVHCTYQSKERLLCGEELDESFVMDIILEKLNSQEIKHYGTCTYMYMYM